MDVRSEHKAMDCQVGSTDWTTIGARIRRAATIASAIHMQQVAEAAGQTGNDEPEARVSELAGFVPSNVTEHRN